MKGIRIHPIKQEICQGIRNWGTIKKLDGLKKVPCMNNIIPYFLLTKYHVIGKYFAFFLIYKVKLSPVYKINY